MPWWFYKNHTNIACNSNSSANLSIFSTSGWHFWDPVRMPPQEVNKTLTGCHHSVVGWSGGHISCCGGPTWPTSDDLLWCFLTSQGVRGPSCCQIAGRYRPLQHCNCCSNGDASLHTSPLHVWETLASRDRAYPGYSSTSSVFNTAAVWLHMVAGRWLPRQLDLFQPLQGSFCSHTRHMLALQQAACNKNE